MTELTPEDKTRIEDFITKLGWDEKGTAEFNDMMKVAEYATRYEREQQAQRIKELEQEVKTLKGILKTELLDNGE